MAETILWGERKEEWQRLNLQTSTRKQQDALACLKGGVFFFLFWLHLAVCGILVPQPGTEPAPPPVEAQSLNYWATIQGSF